MSAQVIVLEFNELSPKLIERFIEEGRLPGFAALRDQSVAYVTDAEEPQGSLEPWIQWITVHTGLAYAEHGVFDLGDGHKLRAPRLWDMASDAGKKVWICGSMNAAIQGDSLDGYLMPDPWSVGVKPYPEGEFEPFFNLVRAYVQEYTRADAPVTALDHARFGAFMAAHGLSPATVARTLQQLASEGGGKNRWKRAMILDRLQWDVFRWYWRKHKPAYATLFLNSTAHLQHYYWRNFEPDQFAIKPSAAELAQYAEAIPQGYEAMDALIRETMAMAPDATIVLCTALSQQPLTKYDNEGGKIVHHVTDVKDLTAFAGVEDAYEYAPVMAEEFRLYFADEAAALRAEEKLAALRIEGAPALRLRREARELYCSSSVQTPLPADALIRSTASNEVIPFASLFYPLTGLKSGYHHPDGVFWVRRVGVAPQKVAGRVSLQRVAPTLAALIGIPDAAAKFSAPALPETLSPEPFRVAAE